MKKNPKIDEEMIGSIVENNENSVLMYPHTYLKIQTKSIVPSVIIATILFILTFVGTQLFYNYLYPKDVIMKIGDIKITSSDFNKIYESDILPVQEDIYLSQENTDIEIEENLSNANVYSRENLYYIQKKILLGLKAEELGFKIDDEIYNAKDKTYGKLSKYFSLATALENDIMNKSTNLNLSEKKHLYNNLKENLIDYQNSTITYQKYYTNSSFEKTENTTLETITQNYYDFCTDNFVKNVPTEDAYYSVANNLYIYYKVISNEITYKPYKDTEEYIQDTYTDIMTEGMRDAFIEEMSQKYPTKIYV